ncbi:MAG: ABC transporter permease [Bryobacterales bacterium]|nr:ABC transporter permease [Bryobacterales bacterium]MBV9401311.1 ABC transporter permease [Bryobacterales bacterium]
MNRLRARLLAPAAALAFLTVVAPLAIICLYSFMSRGAYGGVGQPFTSENYTRLLDPLYGAILWRSFWVAAVSTLICLALGFPLALFIARSGEKKNLYLSLVILPFWTSFLIRTYAWMFLLRDTGLINTALLSAGIIREPLPMLYNNGAVILGLVYGFLPFMVLPLYAILERLDPSLMEAAADLGARPRETLFRVILPLCAPGIRAGAILVFVPCLGTYLTSDLLGGSKTILIGNLVQNQFTSARDWPFGAAASLALMAAATLLLFAARRSGEELL